MASKDPIRIIRENELTWVVLNTQTGATAEIKAITEYNALKGGYRRCGYRIDKGGRTAFSMIRTYATARARARDLVK